MSAHSDEELVGDVDVSFDDIEMEECKNKVVPEVKKVSVGQKRKTASAEVKSAAKKISSISSTEDDMLLAFSMNNASSVKKSTTTNVQQKKNLPSKSTINESAASQGQKQKVAAHMSAIKIQKDDCKEKEATNVKKESDDETNINSKFVEKDIPIQAGEKIEISTLQPDKSSTIVIQADYKVDHVKNTDHQMSSKKNEVNTNKNKLQTGENDSLSGATRITKSELSLSESQGKDVKRKSSNDRHGERKQTISDKHQETKIKTQHDSAAKNLKESSKNQTEGKMNKPLQKVIEYSEEDYKSMDNFLAEQMVQNLQEGIKSQNCGKYRVHISPLEIADLAHPTIQQLIHLHPSLSLVFQHQAVKLKKKKGYADAVFHTVTDLKEFVYQLTQVKVFERRLDINISTTDQPGFDMSFSIHLHRNLKLMNLINSGEDPVINKPIPVDQNPHTICFEKVPSSANAALMHSLFPFANNVHVNKQCVGDKNKDTKKTIFHGPLSVGFINDQWMDAVMTCCTDFTVNGHPLTELDVEDKGDEDDSLTRLTEDVYNELMNSLDQLKDLTPNNPKLKEIQKIQQRFAKFQQNLKSSKTNKSTKLNESMEWDSASEKEKSEMEKLEEIFENKEKIEHAKELSRKQQREKEVAEKRELEKKKKSLWAKSLISDFKKTTPSASKQVSSEAEQMLKQRAERLKEKEDEEKKMKEGEISRNEEEKSTEEGKTMQKSEGEDLEKQKEEEKRLLIQRIEEARQRDQQRAEELSSSQSIWKKETETSSAPESSCEQNAEDLEGGEITDSSKADASQKSSPLTPNSKDQDETIIEEEKYDSLKTLNLLHTLPPNYKVKVKVADNRCCPAKDCPATRCFRDFSSLIEHWTIFHESKSTMRFCSNCTAYFMSVEELQSHMMKAHSASSRDAIQKCQNARVKIIPNPSYRDPSPFILN